MTKLKTPLLSLAVRGTIAKTLTFLRRGRRNLAIKTPIPDDPRSLAQLSWRHMYQKAVALWHALSAVEQRDWQAQAATRHMTGFAWFMSQALKPNPGLYLPLQGGTMTGEIDMDNNLITDLLNPTADQDAATKKYHDDNLPAGGYTQGARVYHSIAQDVPNGVATPLTFDSERYDTDNCHNPGVNPTRLTCNTAGVYYITGTVRFTQNANQQRALRFYLNGTTYICAIRDDPNNVGITGMNLSTSYYLNVGDYLELHAVQWSGILLEALQAANICPVFAMQRIG